MRGRKKEGKYGSGLSAWRQRGLVRGCSLGGSRGQARRGVLSLRRFPHSPPAIENLFAKPSKTPPNIPPARDLFRQGGVDTVDMSGTACCYKGCAKNYSNDKDVSFFKFPDDPKRRKKWMDSCGNPEVASWNDRQLRHKRICADHFASTSFICPVTRNQLTEKAVPLTPKEYEASIKAAKEAQREQELNPKRGRGRPPGGGKFSLVLVKKEPGERETYGRNEGSQDEEEEDVEEEEEEEEAPTENGDVDMEYNPPTLKRQTGSEKPLRTPSKPPKLVAVSSGDAISKPPVPEAKIRLVPPPFKAPGRGSEGDKKGVPVGRKVADYSVIEDVVKEMSLAANPKKRQGLALDDRTAKRLKSVNSTEVTEDVDDDDLSDMEESEEEEEEGLERANREFEMFQDGLRKIVKLPPNWGMGSVVWDPLHKMKVIPITQPKLLLNGTISLFRAIQIFEDSTVKAFVDGVDMTLNFGIQTIESQDDVNKIIKAVSESKVCAGVNDFSPDDSVYLPEARKRGYKYYADSCPVILDPKSSKDGVCKPCQSLQKAVLARKEKEREETVSRRSRPVPQHIRNLFGRSLYGILTEMWEDSNSLRSDNKEERDAVLSKYSTELGVMNGEVHKPEKMPPVQISVEEVAASFQDIVQKLGFNMKNKPASGIPQLTPTATNIPNGQPQQIPRPRPQDNIARSPFAGKPFLQKFVRPNPVHNSASLMTRPANLVPVSSSTPVTVSGTTGSFSLGDGQTYEILGEVGGSDVVQGTKGEAIEIIEVDDETMAKLTAQQNAGGGIFQNSSGGIQVLDASDPNLSQILKAINPSQA